jgi:tetratricopeptide (TPR) repeat protein
LVRRNKTAVAGAAAVLAALVLGFGLSLYLFIQERHALRNEREALARAVAAERRQAELREQAELGLALERRMREMASVGDKFMTAGRYMSQGMMDKAEEVMAEVPSNIPQSSVIYNTLGEVYSRRGDWHAAIRNFSKSAAADPTNHIAYHNLAPLLVQVGDMDGYRSHCQRVLNQFVETKDPVIAERIAKDCLMFPPPTENLKRLGKMADTAIAANPTNNAWPYFQLVKGLAEYRLGQYAGAEDWLGKVGLRAGVPARDAEVQATLAMAQYRLGQTNAAQAALAEGIKIAETKLNRSDRIDWNDQIIAKVLLREAHTLIVGSAPPADVLK